MAKERPNNKELIITKAKELFNANGYNAVSIGDIARELKISKGNITYYFKKKEYIVEAILENADIEFYVELPDSVRSFDAYLKSLRKGIHSHTFFFLNYQQILDMSEKLRKRQIEILNHNTAFLNQALHRLAECDVIKQDIPDEIYDFLTDSIYEMTIYSLSYCNIKQSAGKPALDISQQLWNLMIPYLTEKGLREYREMMRTGS